MNAFNLAKTSSKAKDGRNVFGFEVFIICENFCGSHACAEEFENHFDGVAKATNAGFAVADVRILGDAL
jgi:hypothetical protein